MIEEWKFVGDQLQHKAKKQRRERRSQLVQTSSWMQDLKLIAREVSSLMQRKSKIGNEPLAGLY
jgi:hypothetical protein